LHLSVLARAEKLLLPVLRLLELRSYSFLCFGESSAKLERGKLCWGHFFSRPHENTKLTIILSSHRKLFQGVQGFRSIENLGKRRNEIFIMFSGLNPLQDSEAEAVVLFSTKNAKKSKVNFLHIFDMIN